jgi:hypothetical protein
MRSWSEVRDLLAKNEVFEERRAAGAGLQGVLVVVDPERLVRRQKLPHPVLAEGLQRLELVVGLGRLSRRCVLGIRLPFAGHVPSFVSRRKFVQFQGASHVPDITRDQEGEGKAEVTAVDSARKPSGRCRGSGRTCS